MLSALNDFRKTVTGKAAAALVAVPLAFGAVAGIANDAYAGEAQAATVTGERTLDAVQGRDDMRSYSKASDTQGIGIFINV